MCGWLAELLLGLGLDCLLCILGWEEDQFGLVGTEACNVEVE